MKHQTGNANDVGLRFEVDRELVAAVTSLGVVRLRTLLAYPRLHSTWRRRCHLFHKLSALRRNVELKMILAYLRQGDGHVFTLSVSLSQGWTSIHLFQPNPIQPTKLSNPTQNVINTDPTQVTQPNVRSGHVLLCQ